MSFPFELKLQFSDIGMKLIIITKVYRPNEMLYGEQNSAQKYEIGKIKTRTETKNE